MIILIIPFLSIAQQRRPMTDSVHPRPATGATTTPSAPKAKPKPYNEVITDHAISNPGLFTVHKVDEKYFFEIPDSLLGREILIVVRLSKTPGGMGKYAGEIVSQKSFQFEKGPDNNLFMRIKTLVSQADSTNAISKAVANSNIDPIAASFPIAAYGKEANSSIVDVTDFFRTDNPITGLSPSLKEGLKLSGQAADRSYIQSIHTYPLNTEIKVVKTFSASPTPPLVLVLGGRSLSPAGDAAGAITLEVNTSFLLLPRHPMSRRLYDPRVGYFADRFTVYADDQRRADEQTFIVRWRLEPKPEDLERYRRGELVEPAKPILYYIDPATPRQWRPYLIAGIEDWNKTFEKAGFKNAISAKEWPEFDSTMSLEDARFSVLRYFPSEIGNAYGPNVHDPRSGEILESHIGWYHNVMLLLHRWYMIQCGAVDPKARTMHFDDSLMGNLIRFVSSHEIGHTLGLRHNMGASSTTPVALLRNKAWVEANGHTPSIMDYARFNYVAQPEDHIAEKGLFPRIGDYDKWAIQWGYRYTGLDDVKTDAKLTNRWIIDSLKNPRLWFGGEGSGADPRSQSEDLGDNPAKAGDYGILNLKRVLPQLPEWTREEGDTYQDLKESYGDLVTQFRLYMHHALKYVGGSTETIRSVEQQGPVYAPIAKNLQKEVVRFLNKQLFTTPAWIMDRQLLDKIDEPQPSIIEPVIKIQQDILINLISVNTLARLEANTTRYGAGTYTMEEMLNDVRKGVWSELYTGRPTDVFRRNLQRTFARYLSGIVDPPAAEAKKIVPNETPAPDRTDIYTIMREQLNTLRKDLSAAMPKTTDHLTRLHYEDILDFLIKKQVP